MKPTLSLARLVPLSWRGDQPRLGGATHPEPKALSLDLSLAEADLSLCDRASAEERERESLVRGGSPLRFGVGRPSDLGPFLVDLQPLMGKLSVQKIGIHFPG